ncbi:MAG: succinate dehydrogenase assembly factor 2, partial [Methylococcales bacterium]
MKLTQLYWQCRRGCLELDLLLKKYLENDYLNATPQQQSTFIQLLQLEDDELLP